MKNIRCDQVQPVVITIDGPAGAGKSTVAGTLAERLGFEFLDTGALYRCVTLACLRAGVALRDEPVVVQIASQLSIQLSGTRVMMNDEDVSEAIRQPEVGKNIGAIADNQAVRALLTQIQRECAANRCIVTEGRDQGTVAFPDSPCKIFLVASPEERARRRVAELARKEIDSTYEEVLAQQEQRDAEDAARPVGALKRAEDAVVVNTDGLTLEEVVQRLLEIAQSKLGPALKPSAQGCENSTSQNQGHE